MSYSTQLHTMLVTLQILTSGSSAVDTNSPLNVGQPVEYVLFDKLNYDWKYFQEIMEDKWNFDGNLKLIIHGFNVHLFSTRFGVLQYQMMTYLGQHYSNRDSSQNIVLADWSPLATGGIGDYGNIAANTPNVGRKIAEMLLRWKEVGTIKNWDRVHIIGFSLGAHIAGVVGDQIWRRTGQVIGRITGLDPAGPNFDTLTGELPLNTDGILDKSDAQFVDIYHCNMGIPREGALNPIHGRLGSAMKAGHVDFYPHGGERQSYVCSPQDDIGGCSHMQCVVIYAYGVRNTEGEPTCPCQSYDIFLTSACGCFDGNYQNAIYMGERANQFSTISNLRYFAHIGNYRALESNSGNEVDSNITNLRVLYSNADFFGVQPQAGQKTGDDKKEIGEGA